MDDALMLEVRSDERENMIMTAFRVFEADMAELTQEQQLRTLALADRIADQLRQVPGSDPLKTLFFKVYTSW
jgi:hypothetical protein